MCVCLSKKEGDFFSARKRLPANTQDCSDTPANTHNHHNDVTRRPILNRNVPTCGRMRENTANTHTRTQRIMMMMMMMGGGVDQKQTLHFCCTQTQSLQYYHSRHSRRFSASGTRLRDLDIFLWCRSHTFPKKEAVRDIFCNPQYPKKNEVYSGCPRLVPPIAMVCFFFVKTP
mmetsp:Transcript_9261/g.21359  ORF Transcript_9261/g.21359 Transcript_9261/m.21359 type:complete len:173 (+) Transcript_9261:123-641(+)